MPFSFLATTGEGQCTPLPNISAMAITDRMSQFLAGIGRGQMEVLMIEWGRRAHFEYYSRKILGHISEIEFFGGNAR